MRIPPKVSIAVGALALAVFGPIALWQAAVERRDLVQAVEQELMLTGRAMRVSTQNALRDKQLQDVETTVSALETIRADVDVLLFGPDGALRDSSAGARASLDVVDAEDIAGATGQPEVDLDRRHAVVLLPIELDGERVATLAIVRPLHDVVADLRRELGTLAVAVLAFTVAVAALAYGLGELLVGRPLARLSAAMQRVGRGDMRPSLDTKRDDEVGRLARDFAAMVAELERARARLEAEQDAHRRSTRALQDADRLVTVGQLSAGLAHEIGSPLQVLHGRARRLLRHADDAQEVRRAAEVIAVEAERITRIVQQLLHVARRRARHVVGHPGAALRSVVDLLEVEARRKRVDLQLVMAEDVRIEWVESDVLQQIALNLVRNAMQACAEGGRVVVTLERGVLRRRPIRTATPALRLTVQDDGRGIDPAVRDQLFEPFFTTRAAEGGTGLGLAIVASLVRELGGTVDVTSDPGQGSAFVVELPLGQPPLSEARRG
jgi:signal transduction histidine kinase